MQGTDAAGCWGTVTDTEEGNGGKSEAERETRGEDDGAKDGGGEEGQAGTSWVAPAPSAAAAYDGLAMFRSRQTLSVEVPRWSWKDHSQ